MTKESTSTTRPRVVAAKRLITKAKQLLEVVEGHHVAILVLGFGEKTFEGETAATSTADIAVVDLEGGTAVPIAVVSISWKRVVASLRLVEKGVWQVGKLIREPEYQAVELHPPDEGFSLDTVAQALEQLDESTAAPGQLTLPAADDEKPAGDLGGALDDHVPFQ
jgi:hypothetical protein